MRDVLIGTVLNLRTTPLHVQRFRRGIVFKTDRRLYHSTLGLRVIKKKKIRNANGPWNAEPGDGGGARGDGLLLLLYYSRA